MEIANKKTTKALKQKLKKQEAEQAAQQNAKAVATAAAAVKSAVAQKAAVVKKTQQENKKVEEDKKVAQPKSKAAKVAAGKASQKLKEQKKKQQKKDKEQQKEDKEQQKKEQQKDVGSSPSTDSDLQTSGSAYSILFVVLGTLFVLFGYRFYMPMLFFGGFISFVYITDFLCWYNHFSHSDSIWLVPIVGIIMGVLCMFVYRLGCFTLGAAWGAVNALLLNGILFGQVMHDNISLQVIMPLSIIFFGIICSMYHHHSPLDNECGLRKMLIFSKTSFIGSYIFLRGCGHIIGDYPFELDLVHGEIPSSYDYYLVGTIFLALFGILLQMRFTHKGDCGLLTENENATAEEQKPLVSSTPNGSGSGSGSGCTTQKSTRQADPLQPRGPPEVPKNKEENRKGGVCCR
jgi:chemotaxis protein histidine kinase CheA